MENIRLFIVEDNHTETLVMKLAFGNMKEADVRFFSTGNDLLAKLSEYPEVVIMDLILPDIDGLELIKQIKEKAPQTSIVVISAQSDIEVVALAQQEGIYNYIVKSESCLKYIQQVIQDLILLIRMKADWKN